MEQGNWQSGEEFSASGQPMDSRAALQVAVDALKQDLEDAMHRLASAAERFGQVGEILQAAVDDARAAAEQAEEARQASQEARASIQRDYAGMTNLARQLQERFSALAALSQPFDFGVDIAAPQPAEHFQQDDPAQDPD